MKSSLLTLLAAVVCASQISLASVTPELEGMESVVRSDGTFLVGSPTYAFDRILGAGGMHSQSEMWNPAKLRQRLLLNRMSILPSWDPMDPSIWVKTGNELGDMIYNDLIVEDKRPNNRTPILEGGFRSPSYRGFWATARGFQDDHYSGYTKSIRKRYVSDEFSHFGENYPMFSSLYGGLGFANDLVDASILAGEEYLWIQGESSFWIPVHYRPRIEARADIKNFSLTVAYEDGEYQNKLKSEKGNRKELNGSVYYKCGEACKNGMFQVSAGLSFRAVDDSGHVYTKLDEDFVALPFMELRVQPVKQLTADVMFAVNDRDWLVQDSVELHFVPEKKLGVTVGVKNISGTRLNPMADNEEYYNEDTLHLKADGQMNLIQGYTAFEDSIGNVFFGGRASFWAEHGAETFDTTGFIADTAANKEVYYRSGDVARINDWIYGVTAELWLGTWYRDMFAFKAHAGFEHIDGADRRFEVTPAEFFTSFTADWYLRKSFRISHSLHYRSDARWNLRSPDPLVVKGDWYWDATFEQQFRKLGLFLTGSILHALGEEQFEVPNANYGRLRFVCTVKKTF
ncbi:hypothetical protein [Fibrobacter sp. UWEL]|uniref:hypothetical protein n=1 Tax=Fibrobacter sp. UWEL TaxID=1896209 RepID=UPI0009169A77|nr:hypothetical protein [Fibrobacter sp. UWEL]SHK53703.1 hypothetical protein SAMN05720468_10336 [Fibrobacter sp. UWEL]